MRSPFFEPLLIPPAERLIDLQSKTLCLAERRLVFGYPKYPGHRSGDIQELKPQNNAPLGLLQGLIYRYILDQTEQFEEIRFDLR